MTQYPCEITQHNPENIVRNKYVIITSKRCFDVMITHLLRSLFTEKEIETGAKGAETHEGLTAPCLLL